MAKNPVFWKYYAKYPPPGEKIKSVTCTIFMTYLPYWPKKLIYGALALATRPTRQKYCAQLSKKHKGQKSYSVVIFFKSKLKVRDE